MVFDVRKTVVNIQNAQNTISKLKSGKIKLPPGRSPNSAIASLKSKIAIWNRQLGGFSKSPSASQMFAKNVQSLVDAGVGKNIQSLGAAQKVNIGSELARGDKFFGQSFNNPRDPDVVRRYNAIVQREVSAGRLKLVVSPKPLPSFVSTPPSQRQLRAGFQAPIRVGNMSVSPGSKKERVFLQRLNQVIKQDERFRADFRGTIKSLGLNINEADKWYSQALKGAGQTGVGLVHTPGFIKGAIDKAQISGMGVFTSANIRGAVGRAHLEAAKKTPGEVARAFDPRKPENWANIVLVVLSVYLGGTARMANLKTTKTANVSLNKSSKVVGSQIKTISAAKGSPKVLQNLKNTHFQLRALSKILKEVIGIKKLSDRVKFIKSRNTQARLNKIKSNIRKANDKARVKELKIEQKKAAKFLKSQKKTKLKVSKRERLVLEKEVKRLVRVHAKDLRSAVFRRSPVGRMVLLLKSRFKIFKQKVITKQEAIALERVVRKITKASKRESFLKGVKASAANLKSKAGVSLSKFKNVQDLRSIKSILDSIKLLRDRGQRVIAYKRMSFAVKNLRSKQLKKFRLDVKLKRKRLLKSQALAKRERLVLEKEVKRLVRVHAKDLRSAVFRRSPVGRRIAAFKSRLVASKKGLFRIKNRLARLANYNRLVVKLDNSFASFIKRINKAISKKSAENELFIDANKIFNDAAKAKRSAQSIRIEKERVALRREVKVSKKLSRGEMIKAERAVKTTRNGKPVYIFEDVFTGKIRYFGSRKVWLKAVKRQQRLIKEKIGDVRPVRPLKLLFDPRVKVVPIVKAAVKKNPAPLVIVKDKVAITTKKGNIIRVKDIISRPVKKVDGVQVKTSDGQVLLLKTKSVVKAVSGVKVRLVRPKTLNAVLSSWRKLSMAAASGGVFSAFAKSLSKEEKSAFTILVSGLKHDQVKSVRKALIVAPVQIRGFRLPQRISMSLVSFIALSPASVSRLKSVLEYIKKARTTKKPPLLKVKRKLSKPEKEWIAKWVFKNSAVYRPSLAAVIFGITGYKIPKSVTGFEIRPILVKRPTKKKRVVKTRKRKAKRVKLRK